MIIGADTKSTIAIFILLYQMFCVFLYRFEVRLQTSGGRYKTMIDRLLSARMFLDYTSIGYMKNITL